jgi:predicted transcriptional regulator of viral defense system
MRYKNISTHSYSLLSSLIDIDKRCFTNFDAKNILNSSSESSIKELLSDMTKRGLLLRLKKGLYYIIPFEDNPKYFIPDWHIVAKHLAVNNKYYIGYYSALQIHDLIVQPSLNEQIVFCKQIKPSTINIKNIKFQFIYHNKDHFFGFKETWIDNFNKVMCSDLEKTLIDSLFIPSYSGGISEIARALYNSRNRINYDKLWQYLLKFNSQAVIKRLGFLMEILNINNEFITKLLHIKSKSIALLDTELPDSGKIFSRWSIKINIDIETIKSSLYT